MPLAPCVRCKKLFNKTQTPVCGACEADEQSDCDKVRDILEEHPNLSSEEVAERAEVDISVVHRMLDKGMIAVMTGTELVKCGRCGAPAISLARKLCQACLEKLNAEMVKAQASIKLGEKKETKISGFTVRESFEEKRR
jgi:ribosomal protein L37E